MGVTECLDQCWACAWWMLTTIAGRRHHHHSHWERKFHLKKKTMFFYTICSQMFHFQMLSSHSTAQLSFHQELILHSVLIIGCAILNGVIGEEEVAMRKFWESQENICRNCVPGREGSMCQNRDGEVCLSCPEVAWPPVHLGMKGRGWGQNGSTRAQRANLARVTLWRELWTYSVRDGK